MKNYQVTFYFTSAPYSQSFFVDNVVMQERMIGEDSDHPFKCIEFLRRGKQVASFYPTEETKYDIRVLDF